LLLLALSEGNPAQIKEGFEGVGASAPTKRTGAKRLPLAVRRDPVRIAVVKGREPFVGTT
jgi:hypothetical protein